MKLAAFYISVTVRRIILKRKEVKPMTLEELNRKLYDIVSDEQEKYREWLLSQLPSEIIHHCFEYSTREDVVCALEDLELSEKQCKALLKSKCPLADLYRSFTNRETDHMDDIRDTIECRANEIIRRDFIKRQREASR